MPVFDASTLSQNRRRRFNGTTVAQDIFDAIVEQAIAEGLVDGTVLYTDSTHLKANANKNHYDLGRRRQVAFRLLGAPWMQRLIRIGKLARQAAPEAKRPRSPGAKETKVSRTDPQSGYMVRDGKPKGFFYLDHRTVDGRLGIITDTYATPANVHDSHRLPRPAGSAAEALRFRRRRRRPGCRLRHGGDRQGAGGAQHSGVIGYRTPTHRDRHDGEQRRSATTAQADGYRCPQGQLLNLRHHRPRTATASTRAIRRICRNCPLLASCTCKRATQPD